MGTSIDFDKIPTIEKYAEAQIFVIDDEQLVVDTLTFFLESAGFKNIHGFDDSSEALDQMRFIRPDVIFTDIRMPGMSGNAMARMVRSFPHLYSVPIIAITADRSSEASRSMMNDGAESVLVKPVDRDVLVERTIQAIDNVLNEDISPEDRPDIEFYFGGIKDQNGVPTFLGQEESEQDRQQRRKSSFRE